MSDKSALGQGGGAGGDAAARRRLELQRYALHHSPLEPSNFAIKIKMPTNKTILVCAGFAQLDSEAPPPSPTALGTEAERTTSGSPIAPVAEDTAAEEDAQVRSFWHLDLTRHSGLGLAAI